VAGLEAAPAAEVRERIEAGVGDQPDAAAVPAVAAVGTAEGNELLAPETDAAVAARPCLDSDGRFVDEFHPGAPRADCAPSQADNPGARKRKGPGPSRGL